jgi:hypothetical protein
LLQIYVSLSNEKILRKDRKDICLYLYVKVEKNDTLELTRKVKKRENLELGPKVRKKDTLELERILP